ncbi:MAG: hypothetical protein SGILL_006808 [Bacillariaceae sp.]
MISSLLHRSNSNSYTDVPSAELGDTSSRSSGKRRNKDSTRGGVGGNNNGNSTLWNRTDRFFQGWSWKWLLGIGMIILLGTIVAVQQLVDTSSQTTKLQQKQHAEEVGLDSSALHTEMPMPSGVNFGSWLSLEDYFFAGNSAVEVATPGTGEYRVAACLPPLHVGQHTGPKWYSETDLLGNMSLASGSWAHAIEVFQAHRSSFIDLEVDLERLSTLGIKNIRVPMSWCLTDHDPRTVKLKKMKEEDLIEAFTCEDPFFGKEVLWPAIPKALVQDFLRACNKHGVRAALDIHTYPGGTSIGTFSGVWPRWPKFWTEGDVQSTDYGATSNPGHVIFSQFVEWMESLSESDPEAFAGLRGLSPMNEPAHLAGMFSGHNISDKNYLPPLPPSLADKYLQVLKSTAFDSSASTKVPNGTHLRVFWWFQGAIDIFRNSKLPSLGKELHANIHESIFSADCLSSKDEAKAAAESIGIIASWWCSSNTTTPEERESWSILDVHHYNAWSSKCSGTVDGQDSGYACGDEEKQNKVLEKCTRTAPIFREIADATCGEGAKLMSAEFSASSHHSVRRSCNSVSNLRESYVRQVNAAQEANVELFYWSYHMPYGGAFRRAWSFQHLMYLLGIIDQPDEPQFECNDHVPDAQEPNDDVWQH